MQYKALNFVINDESVGFFGGKIIPKEEKLKQMEEKLNELAKDGWRVHQMSTNTITSAGTILGYNVLVIMEKE